MKTLCTTVLTAILALFPLIMQAQKGNPQPDQVKLLKQFVGNWKAIIGTDTIAYGEYRSFGKGIDGHAWKKVGDKTIFEMKQLFGYDSETDKFIELEVSSDGDTELWICWFTSENVMVGVPYENIDNPDVALFKVEIVIQSSESYQRTLLKNGKPLNTRTMIRQH